MKRTISVMLGKGSVNHNTRKFKAENIDSERTVQNIAYINIPIKNIYHELFDDVVKSYNEKQTRNDRRIDNYYEKSDRYWWRRGRFVCRRYCGESWR